MTKRKARQRETGLPAADWEQVFRAAKIEVDRLDEAKSRRAKATLIGNFLARNVGRDIVVDVDGRSCRARLRMREGRGNQKIYFFEVTGEGQPVAVAKATKSPASPRRGRSRKKITETVANTASEKVATSKNEPGPRRVRRNRPATGNEEKW